MATVAVVTPPSPPYADIDRQAAGSMGLWKPRQRSTVGHSEFTQYDLSLLWTAGVLLEDGHAVHFIDGQAERLDEARLTERVARTSPDAIIGMIQLVSLDSDVRLLSCVKNACGDPLLIVVGPIVRLLTDQILSYQAVDIAVVSEPEMASREILEALGKGGDVRAVPGLAWRGADTIERSQPRSPTDLSSLSTTPYQLLQPYQYIDEFYFRPEKIGLVATTRGCPYDCAYYCPYPAAFGKKVRQRPPEVVVREIEFLNKQFGIRSFYFRDQVFTISAPHAREICQRIVDANLGIRWICETRVDLLRSDALLDAMRDAGCVQIHFGLESGDSEMFKLIGKPGTDLGVAKETTSRVKARGMQVHFHIIVGLPGETWGTIANTYAFIRDLGVTHVNLNRCIPYPGTALRAEAISKGWLETDDWTQYGRRFVMRTADMSTAELEMAMRWLTLNLPRTDLSGRPIQLRRRDRFLTRPVLNATALLRTAWARRRHRAHTTCNTLDPLEPAAQGSAEAAAKGPGRN